MNLALQEFENSLNLWIPSSKKVDRSILIRLNNCQQALSNLLDCEISWQDYLDILQSNGVDMDDYLNISHENIISCGF